MNGIFSILRRVFLCAALLSIVAGNVEAAGYRVEAIEVRGATRVAPDAVRKVMSTQIGQELDLEKVRQDVKAIYRMGYFRDVTFDTEEVPGGYRLTVIVAEKPIVSAVQIEGNKDVDTADLRAAVTVKERSLFQEEKVKESVNKLKEVANNKGFIDASVEASVAEDSEGALRVTFRVTEGPKLKIERIVITGNQFFPTKADPQGDGHFGEGILLLHHRFRGLQKGRPRERRSEDRGSLPEQRIPGLQDLRAGRRPGEERVDPHDPDLRGAAVSRRGDPLLGGIRHPGGDASKDGETSPQRTLRPGDAPVRPARPHHPRERRRIRAGPRIPGGGQAQGVPDRGRDVPVRAGHEVPLREGRGHRKHEDDGPRRSATISTSPTGGPTRPRG